MGVSGFAFNFGNNQSYIFDNFCLSQIFCIDPTKLLTRNFQKFLSLTFATNFNDFLQKFVKQIILQAECITCVSNPELTGLFSQINAILFSKQMFLCVVDKFGKFSTMPYFDLFLNSIIFEDNYVLHNACNTRFLFPLLLQFFFSSSQCQISPNNLCNMCMYE